MLSSKEIWTVPSSSGAATNANRQTIGSPNSYAFMTAGMQLQSGSPSSGVMATVASAHDRSQEICKYFINGGCLRGAGCPYLHELPDERHLDVNGLGFILNPNVHNAQKTVAVPQSAVGGNPTAGQVSPISNGSPLAMGLGSQPTGSRQFQFGNNSSNNGKGGTKAHYSGLTAQSNNVIPAVMKQPPKYRPPEPYLEHNLPPVLALPLKSASKDVAQSLALLLLQN